MSDWRQRQKQALRSQLYDTALELFQSHGYEQTTVQQITDAVGVAKGTFFNHFPTKEDVIAEWYDGITFDSLAAAKARPSSDIEAVIVDLSVDMVRRAMAAPELLIAKSRHSASPRLVEAERTQDDEIDEFLLGQCRAARDRGELAESIEPEFLVGVAGSVLTGTSREWVASHPRFDFAAVVGERLRFVVRAAKRDGSASTRDRGA